ncbi:MAG: MFS transporter [Rhodobacteraceae bacterium]|nr:MFS transporter [Paracoccaceae bacterium]
MPVQSEVAPAYRWVIVAVAAAVLCIAQGQIVSGFSVYVLPLEAEFGWARGSVAFVNTAGLLGLGIGGIVMGSLADRVDVRRIALFGAMSLGLGVMAASRATELWHLYLAFFCAGMFGSGSLVAPLTSLVGKWFVQGAGLALGLVAAGQALGQGGVPFGAVFLIESFGWRGAMAAQGAITLALVIPLVLTLRPAPQRPAGSGALGGDYPLPTNTVILWLSAAVLMCCTTMAVPLMHLVPLIQGRGFAGTEAGSVLFVMLLVAITGRIAFGKLADVIGAVPAYFTASAWQTALVFFFTQIETLGGFYAFAVIYGFGYAGVMTGVLTSVSTLTPPERRGQAMGVILAFAFLGHGIGGYQGGVFYDLTGAYTVSYANAVLAGVINLILVGSLFLTLQRRRLAMA